MNKILTVLDYNRNFENRQAKLKTGKLRQTGYVLITDTGERKWFPNIRQAKIERDTPGKYGERGIKI